MAKLRLGQVNDINFMPVYHALEEGQLPLDADLVTGTLAELNKLFSAGKLEITPVCAIEYTQHAEQCYILPNLSISTDGQAGSIFLLSKVPVTELEGKKIALPYHSATARALLKILLEHYYHAEVDYINMESELEATLANADATLLIGEEALLVNQQITTGRLALTMTDLSIAWQEFTSEKMVFAVWAVKKEFADGNPEIVDNISETLHRSKLLSMKQISMLGEKANKKTKLPQGIIENYLQTIHYGFDEDYRRSLMTFYDYAYKSGLIEERIKPVTWGKNKE